MNCRKLNTLYYHLVAEKKFLLRLYLFNFIHKNISTIKAEFFILQM